MIAKMDNFSNREIRGTPPKSRETSYIHFAPSVKSMERKTKTKQANRGIERVPIFFSSFHCSFLSHLWSGYLGYVQRIRPGKTLSTEDFNRGDLIEGYLDYLKVGIKVVLKHNTF